MDLLKCTVAYTKARLKSYLPAEKKKKKDSQCSIAPLLSTSPSPPLISPITEEGEKQPKKWRQALCLVPVYLLQLSYGMNSGFPAILTPQLGEPCSEFSISPDQESWIVSLDNLLTPLVCVTSGFLQQKFGPLRVLMFSCLPYTLGWLVAALATGAQELYASRVLVGVSHAIISTTVYTVEVSSKDMRGTLSMMEAVLRCTGTLMVYSLALAFRWRDIASVAPLVPVLAFFSATCVPESPVYLVGRGREEEAKASLQRIHGRHHNCLEDVAAIKENLATLREGRSRKSDYVRSLGEHPEIYKPLFIIITLSLVQQFSGVSVIRAYVVKIFDKVFKEYDLAESNVTNTTSVLRNPVDCLGVVHEKTSSVAYMSAMVIGVCRLISSLALARLLRSVSRRTMYFISLSLTLASLLTFSLSSFLVQYHPQIKGSRMESIFQWSSLVAVCLLVCSVQLGVQTLPLILSGELFPSDVRASCKGLTRAITCIFLVVTLKMFPFLEDNMHVWGTFLMFSALLLLFSPIVYLILPETKDVRLEMIQKFFSPSVTQWHTNMRDVIT